MVVMMASFFDFVQSCLLTDFACFMLDVPHAARWAVWRTGSLYPVSYWENL